MKKVKSIAGREKERRRFLIYFTRQRMHLCFGNPSVIQKLRFGLCQLLHCHDVEKNESINVLNSFTADLLNLCFFSFYIL